LHIKYSTTALNFLNKYTTELARGKTLNTIVTLKDQFDKPTHFLFDFHPLEGDKSLTRVQRGILLKITRHQALKAYLIPEV
jgi:hypothetical protein